jgi:hypothetical protein
MQKKVMLLAVFLLPFVAMVAWLAFPSVWIAWSAELGPSAVTPAGEEKIEYHGIDLQCIDELEKLCEGIQPGGGRTRKCIDDNTGRLSPACQRQIQEGKADAYASLLERKQRKEVVEYSPIALTSMAIVELTDPPALGGRTTVDLNKRWGSDLGQINKATALLQDARGKVGSGNPGATRLLEEAIAYGKAYEHKESRLSAQGALFHLCKGSSEEACKRVPKYGAYVAP